MSFSSSGLASFSNAMRDCSINCKPSSDSAKNAATTCALVKSISLLHLPRPRGTIVGVKIHFAAMSSARVLGHDRDSFLLHQHLRGFHILRAQARFVWLGVLEQRRAAKKLCLKIFSLRTKLQHLFVQLTDGEVAKPC